jgi:UDP-N-acetylmuramoyl-tripeptide--D-alanyl-D-alanine ligase
MKHLYDALPSHMRGIHLDTPEKMLPALETALQPGDLLLIKGSHGSLMYKLAAALKEKYASTPSARRANAI